MDMDGQSVKVLIADDDLFVREMLSMILESEGYVVDTAEDGSEALKKQKADPELGLIISDMNMPGLSGLELLREIRSYDIEIPIIILTGNDEVSVAEEAIKNGASDCLIKDENIQDTILLSVRKVLEQQKH